MTNDPEEVIFYVGHGGLRFPPPANTMDIAIDTTAHSVRLADFGNRESKFDEEKSPDLLWSMIRNFNACVGLESAAPRPR